MFGGHIKVTSGKYSFERMHYIKEEGFMARMNMKKTDYIQTVSKQQHSSFCNLTNKDWITIVFKPLKIE